MLMTKICRTEDADELYERYRKKRQNAPIISFVLIIPLLVAALGAYGFYAMDDSKIALIAMAAFLALALAIFVKLITGQAAAKAEFTAYTYEDGGDVIFLDYGKACADNLLFGADFDIRPRLGAVSAEKSAKNMRNLNTASKLDEFITRDDVNKFYGFVITKVTKVKEGSKNVKFKVKMRRFGNSGDKVFAIYSKTLTIPRSFQNSDELMIKLRGMSV